MQYVKPVPRTSVEITDILERTDISPGIRIEAVLSAIYYEESTETSGDILIKEFSHAQYMEKIYLKNLFETFYQMRRTAYRIDDSINLLKNYIEESPQISDEIEETIDTLVEFKSIFGRL